LNADDFLGLTTTEVLKKLDASLHPVITASLLLTKNLSVIINPNVSYNDTILHNQISLEIDKLINLSGGLERILNTPLPTVWTSNLRTFLLIYFTLIPIFLLDTSSTLSAGWYTIPLTFITAWVFLGIEAAAVDVDYGPFDGRRVNHVDVDGCVIRVDDDVEVVLKEFGRNETL
jgi:predicted membrane chloride channel (bestrophin family)